MVSAKAIATTAVNTDDEYITTRSSCHVRGLDLARTASSIAKENAETLDPLGSSRPNAMTYGCIFDISIIRVLASTSVGRLPC